MDLADFFGWCYACCWGTSFYPTLYLNYKLRTSDSISLDFMILNILGYLCYSVSIYLQLYNEEVRNEYMLKYDGKLPILSISDISYAFHGLSLLVILLSQIIFGNRWYGFENKRQHLRIHRITKIIVFLILIILLYNHFFDESMFKHLNLALNLAYFKIITSLIKYIPQVTHNYRRKSMYGISPQQIYLDLLGVIFCVSEFIIKNDLPMFDAINSNRGKLGIIVVTTFFDTIFLVQIYIYGTEQKDIAKFEKFEKLEKLENTNKKHEDLV